MRFKNLLFLLICLSATATFGQDRQELSSPDQKIKLVLSQEGNGLKYSMLYENQPVIAASKLGLKADLGDFSSLKVKKVSRSSSNTKWKPLYGKTSEIVNNYKQLTVSTQTAEGLDMTLVFRMFDDGLAFRYEIPKQKGKKNITVSDDVTEFHFPKDFKARAIDENIEHSKFRQKSISGTAFSKMPLLVHASNCWIAINEAAVNDFSSMFVQKVEGQLAMKALIDSSATRLPMKTPWRVIQLGRRAGEMITSNILPNLNEPCKIKDVSWIKQGKTLWDWRNHGHVCKDGFVYGLNEKSYHRYIDFASENDFAYVLFDAGWWGKKGPQSSRRNLDMPKMIKYAKDRGVGVILYLDRKRRGGAPSDWKVEDVLKTFSEWGAAGVKYGFLKNEFKKKSRKEFVDETRRIIRIAAENKLLVNFHDNPIHPGGEERTWPNRISIEYCHAQQDSRASFGPDRVVSAAYMNGLSGNLDMANGFYALNTIQNRRKVSKKGLNSTVAGETARCMIFHSPLLILGDNGDAFKEKWDLFNFIHEMPNSWDETRFVAGEPGEYVVLARRIGKKWFLAGNTNEKEREITLPLDFLGRGSYGLTQYLDAKDTHYIKNKEAYEVKKSKVKDLKEIKVRMAPGGGFGMTFTRL